MTTERNALEFGATVVEEVRVKRVKGQGCPCCGEEMKELVWRDGHWKHICQEKGGELSE